MTGVFCLAGHSCNNRETRIQVCMCEMFWLSPWWNIDCCCESFDKDWQGMVLHWILPNVW